MGNSKNKNTPKSFAQLSLQRKLDWCRNFNTQISEGKTGSLEQLAEKFGIPENFTIDILIYMMEELKCPIEYNQNQQTYFYNSEHGKLRLGFTPAEDL